MSFSPTYRQFNEKLNQGGTREVENTTHLKAEYILKKKKDEKNLCMGTWGDRFPLLRFYRNYQNYASIGTTSH